MILDLDHVNIVTPRLAETRDFFVQVLGLVEGFRPDLGFDGHWLYAGDKAVIHLQSLDGLGGRRGASGPLDHVAFQVADFAAAKARLQAAGVDFREVLSPPRGQLFLNDPNGVRVELGGRV